MRKIWLAAAAFAVTGCNGVVDGAAFVDGQDGTRCSAKVLAIGDTGETINEDPVARLTLRVAPPHGARPFETTIEATVPRLAMPHKGDMLPVVCDSANPDNTALIE